MKTRKPHVGDTAHHPTLDSRPVAEVSEDGTLVKLDIFGYKTAWVPAQNYRYTAPPEPVS